MFIDFPETDIRIQGLEDVVIPPMVTVHQAFDDQHIEDVPGTLAAKLQAYPNHEQFAGKRICITVGSRGIPELPAMVRTMCDTLKGWGADPFIIPAMGSHAGATAEGQREMLAGYGITPDAMGVDVVSSMEVVQYGEIDGVPLYCDKNAAASDGIVIFNKVKPHTEFRAPHESGLAKMIAIGIAKHKGATTFHSFGFDRFKDLIPRAAEEFVNSMPVAFGVGVVQNAYDDICAIEVCSPENLLSCDAELLKLAFDRMPKFLFDHIDLLIIDEIGKNISGNGQDPNITGRNLTGTFYDMLDLKKMVLLSLTPESHHNGAGIAFADIVPRALLNDIDWGSTWTNTLTTGVTSGSKIPLYANTEEDCVRIALRTCPGIDFEKARIVHIVNTLKIDTIQVSVPLYESIKDVPGISFVEGPFAMEFDENGNLVR